MGERIRDWIVAVSLAAALGVLVGGVYSGVTGWEGPAGGLAGASSTTRTAASTGSGLPTPNEPPSPAAAGAPATVRTAGVLTVRGPGRGGPVKATGPAKTKPADSKSGKDRGCQDGDGGNPGGERGQQCTKHDWAQGQQHANG